MPTYEKWNDSNTERVVSVATKDAFKIAKLIAKGYLLVVNPEQHDPAINKLGAHTFTKTERSWSVVNLTQQEKDAYQAAQQIAQDAIDRLAELNAVLAGSAFKGKSLVEAKAYSDETATDLAGIQKVLRKVVEALMSLHPHEI